MIIPFHISRDFNTWRWKLALFFVITLVSCDQEKPAKADSSNQTKGNIIFNPIEIRPSPFDNHYQGRFRFINNGTAPVKLPGYEKPIRGVFEPQFVAYQQLLEGKWTNIKNGYSGLPDEIPMDPQTTYEFVVLLVGFREQATPITGRIKVGEYFSEPFDIDWKRDLENGKFAMAKREHLQKVRAAFVEAGFRDELLVEDDFTARILGSMMKMTSAELTKGLMEPFQGKFDNVVPEIRFNGNIRIDFSSDEVRDSRSQYRGIIEFDPRKFSRRWLLNNKPGSISVGEWREGIEMDFQRSSLVEKSDDVFYLSITYLPFDKSKIPTIERSAQVFAEIIQVLEDSLVNGVRVDGSTK